MCIRDRAMGAIKPKKENQNIDVVDNRDKVVSNKGFIEDKINERENFREVQSDALSALVNLGYSQGDAASAIAQIALEGDETHVQDLIRNALKILAPKG